MICQQIISSDDKKLAHLRLDVRFDRTQGPLTKPDCGELHPMGPLHQKRTRFQARVVEVPPTRRMSQKVCGENALRCGWPFGSKPAAQNPPSADYSPFPAP